VGWAVVETMDHLPRDEGGRGAIKETVGFWIRVEGL